MKSIDYVFRYHKSKFDTTIYKKIAFAKTTSFSDTELYCDLILNIDINKIRDIIFKNYICRKNFILIKKYCEIAIQKKLVEEYAHEILCKIYIFEKKTSPEDIKFIEEHFILCGSKKNIIAIMCDYFKKIDAEKYKKYLLLGSKNNIFECVNKLGLLCIKEKKFPEALEYFNKCIANKFYVSGINLMNYYIEVEPNETEVEKYFFITVSNGSKTLKEIVSKHYIKYLHKNKNFTKAESILHNLDQSKINNLCWYAEHYFRAGNFLWGEHFINEAIRLIKSKLKKEQKDHSGLPSLMASLGDTTKSFEPEFTSIQKKLNVINKKSLTLTTQTDNLFPIGLWFYREIINGSKFKQLFTDNKIIKFYENFENLINKKNEYNTKFEYYKNLLIEYLSEPKAHSGLPLKMATQSNTIESFESKPNLESNEITPKTIYKEKRIGKWFFNTIKLIKYHGDCIHQQFDKITILNDIIRNELKNKIIGECGICHDNINTYEFLYKLQCCSQYLYHPNCMENWKKQCHTNKKNWTCPFCRANLDIDIFGNEIKIN
jgi:hypothetical protein